MLPMTLSEMWAKRHVLRDRPRRIADYFREPRPLVVGGPIANQLGLQVARACIEEVAWQVRQECVTERVRGAYETVIRDGVVTVPDFLPPAAFEAVRAEFERSRHDAALRSQYKVTDFGENYLDEQLKAFDWPDAFPASMHHLRDNAFLLELASAITKRRMSFKPDLVVQVLHKPSPDAPHTDTDDAQCAHADRHYNFIKAFFYLNDVGEGDAPYTYVPGSHRMSWARLRYEYAVSQRSTARVQGETPLEQARRIYAPSTPFAERRGLRRTPLIGKANTLIVSNNKGLHMRGQMTGRGPRTSINIDFKYLESLAHHLYPLFKHLVA